MTSAHNAPERPSVGREALRVEGLVGCGGQASVELVYWGAERLYLKRPLPHLSLEQRREALEAERAALEALDAGVELIDRRFIATLNTDNGSLIGLLLRPVDGATISQLSRQGSAWAPHEIAHLFQAITQALQRAWEVGLQGHGDLSLANMMLDRRGQLWIIDWSCPQRHTLWPADQRALASMLYMLTTGQQLAHSIETLSVDTLERAGWPHEWASLTAQLSSAQVNRAHLTSQVRSLWSYPLSLLSEGSLSELQLRATQEVSTRVKDWVQRFGLNSMD